MIYVTGRRLSAGGSLPSHITDLSWSEVGTGLTGLWARATMVDWIDNKKGEAKVKNAFGIDVRVHTVHPSVGSAYVQTSPDNTTTDNLLSLPPC